MKNKQKNTDTTHYLLTFASIVLLAGCFATHIITGDKALIIMDSLAGSLLLGTVFLLYICWMIYDTSEAEQISLARAGAKILRTGAASYCVYAYWIVFICIPVLINIFS